MNKLRHKKTGRYRSYENLFMTRFVIGFMLIMPWSVAVAQYQALAMPVLYEKAPQEAQNAPTPIVKEEVEEVDEKAKYQAYARKQAKANGVSERWIIFAIDVESGYSWNPKVKSTARYTFSDPKRGIVKGELEKSRGLCQIHEPDNPGISKETTEDPYWCIDFMIKETKNGNYDFRWKNTYKKYRIKYPL